MPLRRLVEIRALSDILIALDLTHVEKTYSASKLTYLCGRPGDGRAEPKYREAPYRSRCHIGQPHMAAPVLGSAKAAFQLQAHVVECRNGVKNDTPQLYVGSCSQRGLP
jgi:hypothetical protein